MAAAPERPIVSRCFLRQVDTACFEHFQLEQLAFDIAGGGLIANALEDFTENDIREPETLAIELRVEPIGLRIRWTPRK